ncbi:hypothetical protein D1871_18400 [Nakamurella silvestris]|nr:hypothetical protein D1871_18400 [Nakamurella silvestris]
MNEIEDRIRTGLHTSSRDRVPPSGWANSLDELLGRTKPARASRGSLRWTVPVIAAAATVLAVIPIWLVTQNRDTSPAGPVAVTFSVKDGRVSLDGLSFPVPAGWTAIVTAGTGPSTTVCVSPTQPSGAGDCDGVTVTAAAPTVSGSFQPIPDPSTHTADACRWVMLLGQNAVGGRAAIQYSIACSPNGQKKLFWYLTDGSLVVSTPPAAHAAEAAQIVDGLDLSEWQIQQGADAVEVTSAPMSSS